MSSETQAPSLRRHLKTTTLTLYGVGVIIGAGIYVLVGKIAGVAGNAVWAVFIASACAALPTGLSYAELASRYPKSAGEAVYADRAFKNGTLSFIVGFLILASGIASTAALSHGFAGYFAQFIDLPRWSIILIFLAVITGLNHRGIREATWVNVLCTVVSVGALIILVIYALPKWGSVDYFDTSIGTMHGNPLGLVVAGAALAFYAYIGFEDICNVAEEVVDPEKTIPRAIIAAMLVSTIVYIGVGITVVSVASPLELEASEVPLAVVAERLLPFFSTKWLSGIALFAVFNSALFNMIMCSRILYGMARSGWIPDGFGRVHVRRQTPTTGVLVAGLLAMAFALTGFLKVLAESTNVIILLAFCLVNVSLIGVKVKKRYPDNPARSFFKVPLPVPILGTVITLYMAAQFSTGAYLRAAGLLAVGVVLYSFHRKRK